MFSNVIFDDTINTDIARVNRADGTLYLNPSIWKRLTGLEREFVLLHEAGHVELMTASEFEANNYAVEKFAPVKSLTDAELGKRIVVMSEITVPENYISNYNGVDPVGAIGEAVGKIFETLPMLGIGSKSRRKDQEAAAKAAISLENAKSSGTQKILIVGGMLVIVIVIIIFIFKK
jgi:hypothetical protein